MTRERYADEPDPGPLLTCHRPPCDGRLYHDQVMHDFLAHNPHPITVDSPLGELIAGRIDQAEYRRRMADLERLAVDSMEAEPAPARRRPEPDRSGMVIAWLAVAFGVVLLAIAVVGIAVTLSAAPRSSPDPTAPQPGASAVDVVPDGALVAQVQASASDRSSSGAPHEREGGANRGASPMDRHDGGAP